jgi:hypothetical protein
MIDTHSSLFTNTLYPLPRLDLLLLHSRSTAMASTTGCIDTLPASHHERAHASPDKHEGQPNEHHRLSNHMRLQGEYTPFRFAAHFFIQPLSLGSPSPP